MPWAFLGGRHLDVLSVTGFSLDHAWQYAEHTVIDGRPKLQATGAKLTTGQIKARLHASKDDPDRVIDRYRTAGNAGEALTLQRGDGRIVGRFVVESLSVTHRKTWPDGTVMAAEVTLKLREWAGDPAPTAPARPATPGSALGRTAPPSPSAEGDPSAVPARKIVRR